MNRKPTSKFLTNALACLALCAAIGSMNFASAADAGSGGRPLDTLSGKNGSSGWTCPMHPEVHQHEAGKCPICKMKLVKTPPKRT